MVLRHAEVLRMVARCSVAQWCTVLGQAVPLRAVAQQDGSVGGVPSAAAVTG